MDHEVDAAGGGGGGGGGPTPPGGGVLFLTGEATEGGVNTGG